MYAYIARQPILNQYLNTVGYELLYRDSSQNLFPAVDGTMATRSVISHAVTTFGLQKLTNQLPAFINFTKELLLDGYPYLLNPKDIVIEILEDVSLDKTLIKQLMQLKQDGYTLALDDYTGYSHFDSLLDLVDIVKVDFSLLTAKERKRVAQKVSMHQVFLLAEKVETKKDFEQAVKWGYTLFQGFFFAKPCVLQSNTCLFPQKCTYQALLIELNQPVPDIDTIVSIIQADVDLTYKIIYLVNTLQYYRGNQIRSVKQAVLLIGVIGMRKWSLLLLLQDIKPSLPDELMKTALVRARFAEQLSKRLQPAICTDAFLVGAFSLSDVILQTDLSEILKEFPLAEPIKQALLGENNMLRQVLDMTIAFEKAHWTTLRSLCSDLHTDDDTVSSCYIEALQYTDHVYEVLMHTN